MISFRNYTNIFRWNNDNISINTRSPGANKTILNYAILYHTKVTAMNASRTLVGSWLESMYGSKSNPTSGSGGLVTLAGGSADHQTARRWMECVGEGI